MAVIKCTDVNEKKIYFQDAPLVFMQKLKNSLKTCSAYIHVNVYVQIVIYILFKYTFTSIYI